METGSGNGRAEAQRLLQIAEKLLHSHDFSGSKTFAERALDSDPLVDGVDQVLAVVDVLLASQRRVHDQPDWYAVLHLPRPSSSSVSFDDDSLAIKRSFRRLALLLSPDRNELPCADHAYRFVVDAYSVLSNPQAKSLFDNQLLSNNLRTSPHGRSFWTSCHACCHVFEYDRACIDRTLRCQICMRPFHAGEMASQPPIVPGIDMYYCTWGFFPLGFPGCAFPSAGAAGVLNSGKEWRLFCPMSPWLGNQRGEYQDRPLNAVPVRVAAAKPTNSAAAASNHLGGSLPSERNRNIISKKFPTRTRKVVAKKRVGNYSRNNVLFVETDSESGGQEGKGAGGSFSDVQELEGIGRFVIDVDATEEVMETLQDVPF